MGWNACKIGKVSQIFLQTRNCQDVETLKLTLNDPVNEVTVTFFFNL